VTVRTNEEVSSYKWLRLERLLSSESESSYNVDFLGEITEVPAFRVDDYVVWGLTYRIISSLLSVKASSA
jgi:hypothetical protein